MAITTTDREKHLFQLFPWFPDFGIVVGNINNLSFSAVIRVNFCYLSRLSGCTFLVTCYDTP
jgi:hypothetical protein